MALVVDCLVELPGFVARLFPMVVVVEKGKVGSRFEVLEWFDSETPKGLELEIVEKLGVRQYWFGIVGMVARC